MAAPDHAGAATWNMRVSILLKRSDRLLVAVVAALVAGALFATVMTLRASRPRLNAIGVLPNWREVANGAMIGPPSAPVTLVEFVDYNCNACRVLADSLHAIVDSANGQVRLVIRHYPFISESSVEAARAAVCTQSEPEAFVAFHHVLLQRPVVPDSFIRYAAEAGIHDIASFRECLASDSAAQRVVADTLLANMANVHGTPTLFIDSTAYGLVAGKSTPAIRQAVERLIPLRE